MLGQSIQGGTNLVSNKFKFEEWEVNSYLENRTLIQSDASTTGWGAYCQKTSINVSWCCEEKSLHINILTLRAEKFTILTFWKDKNNLVVHLQLGNHNALTYLVKMGQGEWGDKEFCSNSRTQGCPGVLHVSTDHTHGRLPSRNQKSESRSDIQGGTKIIERVDFIQRSIGV